MKLNVVVLDLYLICEGNLGSCDVVINVGGGLGGGVSTSRLRPVHSFIKQWL